LAAYLISSDNMFLNTMIQQMKYSIMLFFHATKLFCFPQSSGGIVWLNKGSSKVSTVHLREQQYSFSNLWAHSLFQVFLKMSHCTRGVHLIDTLQPAWLKIRRAHI
jgi:hypothetical protein